MVVALIVIMGILKYAFFFLILLVNLSVDHSDDGDDDANDNLWYIP